MTHETERLMKDLTDILRDGYRPGWAVRIESLCTRLETIANGLERYALTKQGRVQDNTLAQVAVIRDFLDGLPCTGLVNNQDAAPWTYRDFIVHASPCPLNPNNTWVEIYPGCGDPEPVATLTVEGRDWKQTTKAEIDAIYELGAQYDLGIL